MVPGKWLWLAAIAALLLARGPNDFLNPQFVAEEGGIFFQQAYNRGLIASFLRPSAGYYHFLLRLTAAVAQLVPMHLAPLVFKVVAVVVYLLPPAYLLADGAAAFAPLPVVRIILAMAYVVMPNSSTVYINVNNAQWHLAVSAGLIFLAGLGRTPGRRAVDIAVLAVFALSGPYSILLAPFAILLWWRGYSTDRRPRFAATLVVISGAMIEMGFFLTSQRMVSGDKFAGVTLAEFVRIISTHGVLNSVFGIAWSQQHFAGVPQAVHVAAVAFLLFLVVEVVRRRHIPLLLLLYLAAVAVAVQFLFPLNDPHLWLMPSYGPRYYYLVTFFVICALVWMTGRGGWRRLAAAGALLVVLAWGVRRDYTIPPMIDTAYREQVAAFGTLPPGSVFFIPVFPAGNWGMMLVRKAGGRFPEPMGGVTWTEEDTYAHLDKPQLIRLNISQDVMEPGAKLKGIALDTPAELPAGGVILRIDGRLFPAVYGLGSPEFAQRTGRPEFRAVGFARAVPISALGEGNHVVEVIVFSADRKRAFAVAVRDMLIIDRTEYEEQGRDEELPPGATRD